MLFHQIQFSIGNADFYFVTFCLNYIIQTPIPDAVIDDDTPEYTSLRHLLGLCLLALRYTNPLVLSSDVRRWVEQGVLPWNNLPQLLPPDMKIMDTDFYTFNKVSTCTDRIGKLMTIDEGGRPLIE